MAGIAGLRHLGQPGNRAMASLHQPAADVAVFGLWDIGELAPDMQVGRMDEAQGHGGTLRQLGIGAFIGRDARNRNQSAGFHVPPHPGAGCLWSRAPSQFIASSAQSSRAPAISIWRLGQNTAIIPGTTSSRAQCGIGPKR